MKTEISLPETTARFLYAALGFVLFGWYAYFLATGDLFHRPFIIVGASLFGIGIAVSAYRLWISADRSAKLAIVAAALLAILIAWMTEPTIFSGRDQGSIAEASIELANHHERAFPSPSAAALFPSYGPGLALNFPGFFYTATGDLTSQFPVGYIAWEGAFFALFGLWGLAIGNAILLVLTLLSAFFLVRTFAADRWAWAAFALVASSFPVTWFAKQTLTENLALALFLMTAIGVVSFLRSRDDTAMRLALLSATLLAVTRIEGYAVLPIVLALVYLSPQGRDSVRGHRGSRLIFPLSAIVLALLINASSTVPFLRTVGSALLSHSTADVAWGDTALTTMLRLADTFAGYGLLPMFIVGISGALLLARNRERLALVPLLLAAPTFIYLVDPSVSADHPWMLRRFVPTILPALALTAALSAASLDRSITSGHRGTRNRLIQAAPAILLGAAFIPLIAVSAPFLPYAENRGLDRTVEDLATAISDRDLVLVDRMASGNPYAMPSGPLRSLYGRNAAYFYKPSDFAAIPVERFDHIYLLAPLDRTGYWEEGLGRELSFIRPFDFGVSIIEPTPVTDPSPPSPVSRNVSSVLWEIR